MADLGIRFFLGDREAACDTSVLKLLNESDHEE